MLSKMKRLMGILIGSTVGGYLGSILWIWIDYQNNPGLYALYSAPWYTQVIINSIAFGVAILVEAAAYLVIRHMLRKPKPNRISSH